MRRLHRLPLRARLVAGFVCAILVLLVAAGAFVYWRVEYALDRALDVELADATSTIQPLVTPGGTVTSQAEADATGVGWQVLDDAGAVVASGGRLAGHAPVPRTDLTRAPRTIDLGSMLPISHDPLRLRISRVQGRYLVVAVDRARRDEALRELLAQLAIAGLGTLLVASVVGDLLARGALRPVERYRAQAAEIARGAAELRLDVPEARDDEVTRLGRTLNDMLASLQAALEHERQFVNEASHELRTPVTVLVGWIEHGRRKARSVEQYQRLLDDLSLDAERLTSLTDDLLTLGSPMATAAHGGATDVVAHLRAAAERHVASGHAPLTLRTPMSPVVAAVSSTVLDRILTNLLGNAVKHGADPIEAVVRVEAQRVVIRIVDSGPGMPPDMLARATDRFARADDARARPGAGLGLSLMRQLIVAAGGGLQLCCGGHHTSHGERLGPGCDHDARMTVTVVLPDAVRRPEGVTR